jgi:hypothetical protein
MYFSPSSTMARNITAETICKHFRVVLLYVGALIQCFFSSEEMALSTTEYSSYNVSGESAILFV